MALAMTAEIERPAALGASWSRRLGAFSALLLAIVVLAHRLGLVATPELPALLGATLGMAVAGLLVGIVAWRRYWYYGDRGGSDVLAGLFWSGTALVPFAVLAWLSLTLPTLHDISTDPENPPQLAAASALREPGMNAVLPPSGTEATLQGEAYPLVVGRRYDLPFDRVLASVATLVGQRGWTPLATRESVGAGFETTIEVAALSPIMRLPSDVAIRVVDEGGATSVDMRAASRYGRHDFGGNAATIVNFLADLDAETLIQAGLPAAVDGSSEGPQETPEAPPIPEPSPQD